MYVTSCTACVCFFYECLENREREREKKKKD